MKYQREVFIDSIYIFGRDQVRNLFWNTRVFWTITIKYQIHHVVLVYEGHTQHYINLNNEVLQSRYRIVLIIVVRRQEVIASSAL